MGLDIGTTGCKCTVLDITGRICSYSYKEYSIHSPGPGFYELNPNEVWEAVKNVIWKASNSYKGEKITALSISSLGEAAVPLDKQGKILYNSLLYTDIRGSKNADYLKERLGPNKIMELTGLPVHSMFTINKLMWMKENQPEVYRNVAKFLLYGDYILYKLGGVAAIDYSLASRTMAFNITSKIWDAEILNVAEVDCALFSPTVPSGTVVGTISKSVATELGLPADLVLVVGGHDHACAALGAGAIKEGIAIDSIGTVECITAAFNQPVVNQKMLDNNFACAPHTKNGMFITYAFSLTGGSLLKWYRDHFAHQEKTEAARRRVSVYALLDAKASREPTGLLVLPHFTGTGTPYMDTWAKGAIVGLSLDVTPPMLYRAFLEGVTYEMLLNIECLEAAGVYIQELRAVGGGAKSNFWLQLKADVIGKKIVALNINEAGTTGTAIIAGTATGVYKSMDEALQWLVKPKKEFYPTDGYHQIYAGYYQKYKRMYQAVKEILS
ncbi:MAG: FGGY-family carbohydrate kinase [Bacteroidota bacterium]